MIVYCCTDLIFATKIGSTAQALGVPARPARDHKALERRLQGIDDGRLNEPVTGVFIDLELGQIALEMLGQVKEHDEKIPVIAFGSHVDTEMLRSARGGGADFVMPRSQFTIELPDMLHQYGGAMI